MFSTFIPWGQRLPLLLGSLLGVISGLGIAVLPVGSMNFTMPQDFSLARPLPPSRLPDGIYFYGQSPQPDVIGQEYFIFQVQGDQVKGALFMPRSEFYCTTGTLSSQKLALLVEDPYGEEPPSPLTIALVPRSPVAQGNQTVEMTLEGYQEIREIGDNDRRILAECL
ncbi:MAG: hypothetical protein VKL20_01105 [Synechocystis sp.]|nr:hypothetical protein [Synechocystis sp.]